MISRSLNIKPLDLSQEWLFGKYTQSQLEVTWVKNTMWRIHQERLL